MTNYLLFKQVICIILCFETLILWPRFYNYFGPLAFPRSLFTTPLRIAAFNLLLLTSLVFLFLNFYSLPASVVLLLCMRYLYVTDAKNRISTLGAVGYVCYLTSAYIFFFELSFIIDSSLNLAHFLLTVLAIEIAIIMTSAGIYKYILGYTRGNGFEYALVNPVWGKFFFLFNKIKPSSWFFKVNNYIAILGEFFSGLLFLIPQTRIWGAYLLIIIFAYAFLTVRVNVLPLLMMSIAMLFIQPIGFQFPAFESQVPQLLVPQGIITSIEVLLILYLAVLISITVYRTLRLSFNLSLPSFLVKPADLFMAYRPYFEWTVFTSVLTHFFVKIEKASKSNDEKIFTVYDGFSKNYGEIFDDPQLFFRFVHHHESSFLLNIFLPVPIPKDRDRKLCVELFIDKMVRYGKTLVPESEIGDTIMIFTFMDIKKAPDSFLYTPLYSYVVDLNTGLAEMQNYQKPEGSR